MLIQFSVENFRSIRSEQTLSLVRASGTEMEHNFFDSPAPATPALLKSAVIYGANAAGKSNMIKALGSMLSIIEASFNKQPKQAIETESFAFHSVSKSEPTIYDISVIVPLKDETGTPQATRVDYGFVVDNKMVYEEWLSVYPKSREQNWFHRQYNHETADYEWKMSSHFKGEKESWKKQTRSDQLFLSSAVHLNSEQLQPIYDAFDKNIHIIRTDRIPNTLSKEICKESEINKKMVISFMQSVGIEIDDIMFRKPIVNMDNFPKDMPNFLKEQILRQLEKDITDKYETFFVYHDDLGNRQEINLNEESDGTQKLFEFAGLILSVLHAGSILVIDELNKSLHPDLVRFLVKLFNSKLNEKNAQLIFTTHETSVLRKDLLRRDQIWFCEKESDRSSRFYPLTDFKPHINREDIEEYYLHGRYGAKPMLTDFMLPENFWEE